MVELNKSDANCIGMNMQNGQPPNGIIIQLYRQMGYHISPQQQPNRKALQTG